MSYKFVNRLFSPISLAILLFFLIVSIHGCGLETETDEEVSGQEDKIGEKLGPHPLRFSHLSIRAEKYLLPAVSTGPLEPDWSPDGQRIAFSMRGDIWKISPDGGQATGLTEGPDYYFEPAWNPDGETIAFTVDLGDRFGIGIMNAQGEQLRHVITDSRINIQPEWSADGENLYFVSDRGEGLSIFKFEVETETLEPVVDRSGNQIQPSVSPDGQSLAYVAPAEGLPGSGGIWIKSLSTGEDNMIHYEETRYRAAPEWSADGESLYYVSEIAGTNDIGIIPANEGVPVWITHDEGDELSPAVSPDGEQLAFVSNREGPTQLFTMPAHGGPESNWSEAAISSREFRYETGQIRLEVVDSEDEIPARIYLEASDGRSYTPDDGFHRVVSPGEQHYFHTDGTDMLTLPTGKVYIESLKGFEYSVSQDSVEISEDDITQVTLRLERITDTAQNGWYSGETHAHDLHGGRFGLTHEDFFNQLRAEDLNVTNALIHRDGTQLMGRWNDLTGNPHPLSTEEYILQYGEEFRGSRGHIGLLGISEYVLPLVGGEGGTAYATEVLNSRYIDSARAQGGIAGFMHPYGSTVENPADGSYSEIPLDVALGKGSFYDILSIPYDAFDNAKMYYHLLNSGFQLAATGGSDNFADVWRDPPAGTDRTYANIDGSLTVDSWLEAVEEGNTFATNGPILFAKVEDQLPGSEISLSGQGPDTLSVQGQVHSIVPLNQIDILLNGEVAERIDIREKEFPVEFSARIAVPDNGWIAVRTYGPYHRYLTDSYPFAHTTPVYVLRDDQRYTSTEDAMFLHDVVDALWQSVGDRNSWNRAAEREKYHEAVEKAKQVYRNIAEGNYNFESRK